MKIVIGLLLFCVVFARAADKPNPLENGVYDYHRRIGIPLATNLKKLESEYFNAQGRIVGGSITNILAVPYQAGLIMRVLTYSSVCGGTLISDSRVLTAAHCINDGNNIASSIEVVLGANFLFYGGTRLNSSSVVLNPDYNPSTLDNDVAIVRTAGPVFYTNTIQPATLPSGTELDMDFDAATAVASGYGITRDDNRVSMGQPLKSVTLRVISNAVCSNIYTFIQSQLLCTSGARGNGICVGDTGGPLVATVNSRRILIGVGSFTAEAGCQSGLPSGWTRVTSFISWIQSQ